MSVVLSYNPLTRCITPLLPHTPRRLQQWCRHKLIAWVGLKNLNRMQHLSLPTLIKHLLSNISLADFVIDGNNLTEECYNTEVYPATCLINNKHVILRIINTDYDKQTCMQDTSYIASFEEDNHWIVIEYTIQSLAERVRECKQDGKTFDERTLWKSLHSLIQHITEGNLGPDVQLTSDCIKYCGSHHFIQISAAIIQDVNTQAEIPNAIYEAPEVLMNDTPDSKALVWSIGCIVYEAIALKPAYLDPSTANPFNVYIDITHGDTPPMPEHGSEELKLLVNGCLIQDRQQRMSLEELKNFVYRHYSR